MPALEAPGDDLYWGKVGQQRPVLINVTASWVSVLPAPSCRALHSHGIGTTFSQQPFNLLKTATFQQVCEIEHIYRSIVPDLRLCKTCVTP